MRKLPIPAVAGLLLAATAAADVPVVPSWVEVDPPVWEARLDVVAACDDNHAPGIFDGHRSGNATVLLPTGGTVEPAFRSDEHEMPRSVVVIAPPAPWTGCRPRPARTSRA